MNRRAERKAENRAKLIAAARKVFAEKGVAAATARDIVRETDLASGTFYNYFDDKEDAFRAVLEEFATEARQAAREERTQPGVSVEERMYNAYRSYFELVVTDPQMFEILRRNADAIAMIGADDLFEQAVRELVEDMRGWIAEGDLPAGLDEWLPYVARSIAGGGFQVAAEMGDAGNEDVDAMARFCTRLLLDGLRGSG
jgi:AcrR family transcriptional regulator